MSALYAWLFDAYPSEAGMTTWWINADGRAQALTDDLTPAFYVQGPHADLHALCLWLRARAPVPVSLQRTERTDLFLDRPIEVLEVGVPQPTAFQRLFRQTADAFPNLTYYDADIPLPQRYVLTRGIFPLAYCAVEHQAVLCAATSETDPLNRLDKRSMTLLIIRRLSFNELMPGSGI